MADTTTNTTIPEWDLGDRMRKALRHGGIGVAEMAEYLDVSLGSVHAWTSGRTKPRTQTLRLWALRTGVDYQWLQTGEGATGKSPAAPDLAVPVRARRDSNSQPSDPKAHGAGRQGQGLAAVYCLDAYRARRLTAAA